MTADATLQFAFQLALAFGRPVSWLAGNLSAEEFTYWCAFSELQPFGGRADDHRAAVGAILPATALNGQEIDPAKLFPSLTPPPAQVAADREQKKRTIGKNFRLWAMCNSAEKAVVRPDQMKAR